MSIRNFYRSKRSCQKDLTEVVLDVVNGNASGYDKSFIKSITKGGDGIYLVEVQEVSNYPLIVSNLRCESGFVAHIESADKSVITIHTTEVSSGDLVDCDFSLVFNWFKGNRIY